jgi:hypothetical protein
MANPTQDELLRTYKAAKAFQKAVAEEDWAAERLAHVEVQLHLGKSTLNGRSTAKTYQERLGVLALRRKRLLAARAELLATLT